MKAQLQSHSFSSHEPCPLFHRVGPFTIKLSPYTHGLSLECTYRFLTLCLKYGPSMYSSPLGSSFLYSLSILFFFFGEVAFQLEYIMAFLSMPMNLTSFLAFIFNKEAQDQRDSFDFVGSRMLGPQHICYLRPKTFFFKKGFDLDL